VGISLFASYGKGGDDQERVTGGRGRFKQDPEVSKYASGNGVFRFLAVSSEPSAFSKKIRKSPDEADRSELKAGSSILESLISGWTLNKVDTQITGFRI
jgi:hypothetical protein